jgi:hypothetical protein
MDLLQLITVRYYKRSNVTTIRYYKVEENFLKIYAIVDF